MEFTFCKETMTVLVATASVAGDMPALLRDQMEFFDLVVVPDNSWDNAISLALQNLLLPGTDVTLIETPKGTFMIIFDEDIDQSKRINA